MTLTLEEMRNDIIFAVCKHCGEQAKFKPAETRTVTKEVWNFPQGRIVSKVAIRRKPQRYACSKCGAPTVFHDLATSMAIIHNRERKKHP